MAARRRRIGNEEEAEAGAEAEAEALFAARKRVHSLRSVSVREAQALSEQSTRLKLQRDRL